MYELIEKSIEKCDENYDKLGDQVRDVQMAQVAFKSDIATLKAGVADIRDTTIKNRQQVERHDAHLTDARGDIDKVFQMISEDRKEWRTQIGRAVTDGVPVQVSFLQSDNFKWLIGGVIALFVLFGMAWGVLTASDVRDLAP